LARTTKTTCLQEKIEKLKEEMQRLHALEARMNARTDSLNWSSNRRYRAADATGVGVIVPPSWSRCSRALANRRSIAQLT
jgi:hypothetical protein